VTKKATTKIFKKPVRATPPRAAARMPGPSVDAQKMALAAAGAGLDKKAIDVEIIDVTGKVDYADYLVLMTGQSDRHVASIADGVDGALSKLGWNAISVEGLPKGHWVLLDFVDIVVHVFSADTRSLYDIDGLWMDARRLQVPDATPDAG
jgi:ribosome-associated protein